MAHQPETEHRLHVELLCGGTPAFEAATLIRTALRAQNDVSCSIIHLDREGERTDREDDFRALEWDVANIRQVRNDSNLEKRYGKDQIDRVIRSFSQGNTPLDDPIGVRLAAHSLSGQVRDQLIKDLIPAVRDNCNVYVAISLVPEGPTGTGVAWALMDWLPEWREGFIQRFLDAGFPNPTFHYFLLEFLPAYPDEQGGNIGNLVQGHLTRQRLHKHPWEYYWFRFDGAKLCSDFQQTTNKEATRIGALAMGLVLASRIIPPAALGEQGG